MNLWLLFYGVVAAWFTYNLFRIVSFLYQFRTYPDSFGKLPNISLQDLAESANRHERDLPSFKIVVPAYLESTVIHGTLERLTSINYPYSYFEILVVTYADEPVQGDTASTYSIASEYAEEFNKPLNRPLVRPLLVPADYDGYFPGRFGSKPQFVGKSRGLNFAIRTIHEDNERDERRYYIGKMSSLGHLERVNHLIEKFLDRLDNSELADEELYSLSRDLFNNLDDLTLSSQIHALAGSLKTLKNRRPASGSIVDELVTYIESQAPRFYLELNNENDELEILQGKEFLYEVMRSIESESIYEHERYAAAKEIQLVRTHPNLSAGLSHTTSGADLYQLTKKFNSRWMLVYDADADAPADLLRFLAARIMANPSAMGFQGPVSQTANYDEVHPICKLGGLWMGFWHNTYYPRLIEDTHWAHPLAGTNWCFRLDGIEHKGCLKRDCRYEESRRRFLLKFDPKQLTEDLEAGIRMFSEWRVNAEWHPYLETEQMPPTPREMTIQRTRWTEGSLQTLSYILKSTLPLLQRLRFAVKPIDILLSGSGPILTLVLWGLIISGHLITHPALTNWTIVLTFANLLYISLFIAPYNRFKAHDYQSEAFQYLLKKRASLLSHIHFTLKQRPLNTYELSLLSKINDEIQEGFNRNGFISSQLAKRCLDDTREITSDGGLKRVSAGVLIDDCPNSIWRHEFDEFANEIQRLAIRNGAPEENSRTSGKTSWLSPVLYEALREISKGNPSKIQQKKIRADRLQIFVWAIPYVFYQLIPYYKGLARWITKRPRLIWQKTRRTPKIS